MQDGHLGLNIRSNIKWNPIIKRNKQVLALKHKLSFKKTSEHADKEIEPKHITCRLDLN